MARPTSTPYDSLVDNDFAAGLRVLLLGSDAGRPWRAGWHAIARDDGTPGVALVPHLYGAVAALYVDGTVDPDSRPARHAVAPGPPGNVPDPAAYVRVCAAFELEALALTAIARVALLSASCACYCPADACTDDEPRCASRLARVVLSKLPPSKPRAGRQ